MAIFENNTVDGRCRIHDVAVPVNQSCPICVPPTPRLDPPLDLRALGDADLVRGGRRIAHVHCSRCGKQCSGVDPELGLVGRAYVQCPECLAGDAFDHGSACINCDVAFGPQAVRYFFGANVVGPFCERCDGVIKQHTGFVPR